MPFAVTHEYSDLTNKLIGNRSLLSKHIFNSTISPFVKKLDAQGFAKHKMSDSLTEIVSSNGQQQIDIIKSFAKKDERVSLHEFQTIEQFGTAQK